MYKNVYKIKDMSCTKILYKQGKRKKSYIYMLFGQTYEKQVNVQLVMNTVQTVSKHTSAYTTVGVI